MLSIMTHSKNACTSNVHGHGKTVVHNDIKCANFMHTFNEKLFILTNIFAFSEGGEGVYA